MANGLQHRCWHHAEREAVARCPECGHSFCRECITEHEDRILCASCLRKIAGAGATSAKRRLRLGAPVLALVSLTVLWLLFYALGQTLLLLPSSFHEGSLWRVEWLARE